MFWSTLSFRLAELEQGSTRWPFGVLGLSGVAPEHKTEARKRGALGCTNRPSELFEYVMGALRMRAR